MMTEQSDIGARLQRIEDTKAIREVKARYFRYMDTREWSGMPDVFTDDAVMDMSEEQATFDRMGLTTGGAMLVIRGRDTIVANMERSLVGTRTMHHGHMPEIEFVSRDEAKGIWPMEDIVELPEGAPVRRLHGYGHYHETYVRGSDGRWRIAHLRLSRLLVEFDPA